MFSRVEMAPRDPILGVNEAFAADQNPNKVNLGVGVYTDENGKIPVLECVKHAERVMADKSAPRGYLPIDGIAAYDKATQALVFGADSDIVQASRAVTVQALGGTGALKVGADFLKRVSPNAVVYISNPSWENHRALFESAGFEVREYTYYDAATRSLDFSGFLASVKAMPAGSIVVLHACCHNPTGVDPTLDQWKDIATAVRAGNLVPFLDMAYQGFGDGVEQDGAVVKLFSATPGPIFVSSSFSKSFSLYGERIGALSVVASDKDEAARVLSQLKRVIRTNYSNPPTHGGAIIASALSDPEARALWEKELGVMRDRIKAMRVALHGALKRLAPSANFENILTQRGMFSYSGLSKDQVHRLRNEFGVYAVDSGRICVAALNQKNVNYVAECIAKVL
ncbi:MAG: aspartate/tyrosine/aromatic aminotransferase [Burkholderiales bacterium]|nr:aspartate/tyrosine/aromatic aminotransferase [Burkholderiales bacterium]